MAKEDDICLQLAVRGERLGDGERGGSRKPVGAHHAQDDDAGALQSLSSTGGPALPPRQKQVAVSVRSAQECTCVKVMVSILD